MFEQQQVIVDKAHSGLLDVARQIKAEFLSRIPEIVQEKVKKKIAENPYVFQQLADPAILALKNRITNATSEAVKLIDSAIDDYTICEVQDLLQEFRSVSRRADGLIAPILEEVGFELKRKAEGMELEEQLIDFTSYYNYNEDSAAQLRYLMKVYNEEKMEYNAAVTYLEELRSNALAKEALERWERLQIV